MIYLIVFAQILQKKYHSSKIDRQTPISIVVAAHNEENNLPKLLSALSSQNHECYEVILVDDRSTDSTLKISLEFPHIRTLHLKETPIGWTGKKYAIDQGIRSAQHEWILLTDADCLPTSNDWVSLMAGSLKRGTEIVVGISPYQKRDSLINSIIQFETLITAIQYISLLITKRPYMAVGRNLLYSKSLYIRQQGFEEFKGTIGGDDDLFINKVATSSNIATCLDQNSYTVSIPEENFRSWIKQKHRHLSVSKNYSRSSKTILGFFHISNMLLYMSFTALFLSGRLNLVITIGLFLRTLAQMVIFGSSAKIFGMKIHSILIPFWDFGYTIFSWFLGAYSLIIEKKTWR